MTEPALKTTQKRRDLIRRLSPGLDVGTVYERMPLADLLDDADFAATEHARAEGLAAQISACRELLLDHWTADGDDTLCHVVHCGSLHDAIAATIHAYVHEVSELHAPREKLIAAEEEADKLRAELESALQPLAPEMEKLNERLIKANAENVSLAAQLDRLDKDLDQVMEERDCAQDALLEASMAMGGPEWCGKLPPQEPPDSGDLTLDVPVLCKELAAQLATARSDALIQASTIAAKWTNYGTLLLKCGEMSAQELRTAKAVASGIATEIRAAIAAQREGT